MLVKVYGSAVFGVKATTITVEVNVDTGIAYHLVGLPDNAVKESSYRITAALQNTGFKFTLKKIIVNMVPADLRKEGSAYDLTFVLGILRASGKIQAENISEYLIMGELSLDGSLQPIKGALPIAIKAREESFKGLSFLNRTLAKRLLLMAWKFTVLKIFLRLSISSIKMSLLKKPKSIPAKNFIKTSKIPILILPM